MNFNFKLMIAFYLLVFSGVCVAEAIPQTYRGLYLGMHGSYDRISDTDNANIVGGLFKIGYDINKFIGLEAHAGATTTKRYIVVDQQGQEIGDYKKRGRHVALYGRANWHFTNITLYGLLGVDYYRIIEDVNIPGSFSDKSSIGKTGLSYGVGVDLFGNSQTALSLNYMQLINKDFYGDGDKTKVDAIHLGITYYFTLQKTNHPVKPRDRLDKY